jgi:ATPase related to the helicase subunit of the Holliday junction resolvase
VHAHARRRLRSEVSRAPAHAHGDRGCRPGRSAAPQFALEAWDTFDRLGSPEGELALAEVAIYLAVAAKSNAAYAAFGEVRAAIGDTGTLDVPLHLRNAPTKLMKGLGYGKGYQYDPDVEGGIAFRSTVPARSTRRREFYRPIERGLEAKIREKVLAIRAARAAALKPKGEGG